MHGFRFLFARFKPDKYFAEMFILFRGLPLSIVPIVFPDDITLQFLF